MVTTIVISTLCKHKKRKNLVASFALQQIKEVGAVVTQEKVKPAQSIAYTCKIQQYRILMLSVSILILVLFVVITLRKIKLFRGHLFSNAAKIMLFILDTKYYVPIKLFKMAGSIHLFKITGTLSSKNVNLKRNKIWDLMEIDWKEVNMTLNGNRARIYMVYIGFQSYARNSIRHARYSSKEWLVISVQFPLWILHM